MVSWRMRKYDTNHFTIILAAALIALLGANPAFAAPNDTQIGSVLCTVVSWMGGNLGKGLEAIFMAILGVSALVGKISWNAAMVEGIGGAIIMGAAQIVDAMGSGAPPGCSAW
ncbi:MAG: hypothetical protein EBV03_00905 [Proteobacteria bacterium]|nr:hypothetical protein [Pseudomonadota bacterium]